MSEELVPGIDPETLADRFEDPALVQTRIGELRGEVISAADEIDELRARGELVSLLRASGELDDALAEGQRARDRAEIAGNRAQQHTARARLARVYADRGEFAESNLAYTELLAESQQFGPVIEAFTCQYAGLNDFAQGHWADARDHFRRALQIRDELELDEPERVASRAGLAAASRRLEEQP